MTKKRRSLFSEHLYVVILVGGKGKRFWPLSRSKKPKAFLSFAAGHTTLLKETVARAGELVPMRNIIFVANKGQAHLIRREIPGVERCNIVQEPESRNTAAAAVLAAVLLYKRDTKSTMVVMPSDHIVSRGRIFRKSIREAALFTKRDNALILFGVRPRYPSVEFGYIQKGARCGNPRGSRCTGNVYRARRFIEKPEKKKANTFYKRGDYLWNSGIFVWKSSAILSACKKCAPDIFRHFNRLNAAIGKRGFQARLRQAYGNVKNISIDYAVLQKTSNLFCIESDFAWNDVGSWNNIWHIFKKDAFGNVACGTTCHEDTHRSLVIARPGSLIGLSGVSDIVVVQTDDALLVCDRKRAHRVKRLVEKMEKMKRLRRYL